MPRKFLQLPAFAMNNVFPLPALLEREPTLVGYYRLLLGISPKRFHRKDTGMSPFKSMEMRGTLNAKSPPDVGNFCSVSTSYMAILNLIASFGA